MQAADHVGPADVAELEGHQDLVIHFRDEVRAAVRPGAQLGDPGPVRLIVVVEPGKLELDPSRIVGVIVVGYERHHYAVDGGAAGGRVAVRGAQRRQAQERAILPATDHEVRAITLLAKHVAGAGERVFAGELVADDAHANGRPGLELGIAVRQAIRFGKGAGDQFGDRSGRAIDLRLLGERPVDGGKSRTAKFVRQARRVVPQRIGRYGSGVGGADHRLLLDRVPTAHLDVVDLLGGRDPRPELNQVVAEDQL